MSLFTAGGVGLDGLQRSLPTPAILWLQCVTDTLQYEQGIYKRHAKILSFSAHYSSSAYRLPTTSSLTEDLKIFPDPQEVQHNS